MRVLLLSRQSTPGTYDLPERNVANAPRHGGDMRQRAFDEPPAQFDDEKYGII